MVPLSINQLAAWALQTQHKFFGSAGNRRSQASITYYDNRRRGYVPLATRSQSTPEDHLEANSTKSSAYRIVMVGDYKSGVSTVRSEFIRMSCTVMPDFGDSARSISVAYADRNLELWLFMDILALQDYFQSLSEPVDCCIACYSSADNETVDSLLNRWLPVFYEYFPHKPAIVCELIDCNTHEDNAWPPNWREVFANVECQLEISVFEKSGLRSLFDEAISSCDANNGRIKSDDKKTNCNIM